MGYMLNFGNLLKKVYRTQFVVVIVKQSLENMIILSLLVSILHM